jgi:predicted nuclease of predicted toxin-antitoxin system
VGKVPKLYFDEDMSVTLAARLRKAGWDVLTTRQAGHRGEPDEQQLQHATAEGRVLVTRNIQHFTDLHRRALEEGRHHHGIIICFWRPSAEATFAKLVDRLETVVPTAWPDLLQYA